MIQIATVCRSYFTVKSHGDPYSFWNSIVIKKIMISVLYELRHCWLSTYSAHIQCSSISSTVPVVSKCLYSRRILRWTFYTLLVVEYKHTHQICCSREILLVDIKKPFWNIAIWHRCYMLKVKPIRRCSSTRSSGNSTVIYCFGSPI